MLAYNLDTYRQAIDDDFNWVIMLFADEVGTDYLLTLKFIIRYWVQEATAEKG